MNLCLDIGNTLIKAALFEGTSMIEKQQFPTEAGVVAWTKDRTIGTTIISSVRGHEEEMVKSIENSQNVFVFSSSLRLPITSSYQSPLTLGKDRLAGAVGAVSLFPDQTCLVISAGTCITYDLVTSDKVHVGGAISPGMHMRFKALNHFTAKLPLVQTPEAADLIGLDTFSSIQSGVVNGMKFEIERAMEEYDKLYPNLKVILCGGDAQFFESIIKGVIFAFPDLVLFGLNHTLLYNAHN